MRRQQKNAYQIPRAAQRPCPTIPVCHNWQSMKASKWFWPVDNLLAPAKTWAFSFFCLFFFTAAIVARRDKRKGRTHSLQLCIQDIRAEPWQSITTEKEKPRDMWSCDGFRVGCLFSRHPLHQSWLIEDNILRLCWHSSTCPLRSALAQAEEGRLRNTRSLIEIYCLHRFLFADCHVQCKMWNFSILIAIFLAVNGCT